jgi:hypothetical protein
MAHVVTMPLKGLTLFDLAFPFANALEICADYLDSLDKLEYEVITDVFVVPSEHWRSSSPITD